MKDLQSTRAMWWKAWLFLLIGFMSGALLILENFAWRTGVLLACCVWGFCRFYFFAFYVIERWVDPGYKFSGLGAFIVYAWRHRRGKS